MKPVFLLVLLIFKFSKSTSDSESDRGSLQYHHNYSRVARYSPSTQNENFKQDHIIYKRVRHQPRKIATYFDCPPQETGQFVYEMSCNQFLNCWKGRGVVQNCAPGTLFNPKTLECDYSEKVECITGPRQNTLDENQKYTEQIGCPRGFTGLIPNYQDCSKFINCNNGVENPLDCPPGTLFDITRNVCDFAQQAECFNGQKKAKANYKRIVTYPSDLFEQFNPICNSEECHIKCPPNTIGLHEHPFNCSKFLKCNNGQTVIMNCVSGAAFNPTRKFCDYSYKGKCELDSYRERHSYNPAQETTKEIKCPRNAIGLHKHPYECSKFLNCANGQTFIMDCAPGTLFNPVSKICDFPYKVKCEKNQPSDVNIEARHSNGFHVVQPDPGYFWNHNRPNYDHSREQYGRHNAPSYNNYRQNSYWTPNQPWYVNPTYNRHSYIPVDWKPVIHDILPHDYYQGGGRNHWQPSHRPNYNDRPVYWPNYQTTTSYPSYDYYDITPRPVYRATQRYITRRPTTRKPSFMSIITSTKRPIYFDYDDKYNTNFDHYHTTPSTPITTTRRPIYTDYGDTHKPGLNRYQTTPKILTTTRRAIYIDYDDTYKPGLNHHETTPKTPSATVESSKQWPPPFPSTDVNADYVFEYDDDVEVTLEAENSILDNSKPFKCDTTDSFRCNTNSKCIPKILVCNGIRDCTHGDDERECEQYLNKFVWMKNSKLAVMEKQRWDNITVATCAMLCTNSSKIKCKSFNYRKIDKTCFLSNTNIGETGALISYYPCDFYEMEKEQINCENKYKCPNQKCIDKDKICDGIDNCGDRTDEKGCNPKDFGYSVKLTGSRNKNEGSVVVTAFGKTGYVCDDLFGKRNADVVCKELGYLGAMEAKSNSYFAKNVTNPYYMMDDVTCAGNETSLVDCDFSGWGNHNCQNQEVAGVICKTPYVDCATDYWKCDTTQECVPLAFLCDGLLDCSDDSDEGSQHCDAPAEIRLVNGKTNREGRVEIRHHGIWGTICDDDFNENAAKVVCRTFGFHGSATVVKDSYYGSGKGPIWLDQVICNGSEARLDDCYHWNWGEQNCDHNEDVGVICSDIYEYERHSHLPKQQMKQSALPLKCGYRHNLFNKDDDVHFRVVRGSLAKKGDYPWQAALRIKALNKPAHWCGAVVISSKFVLTAAHCLIGYSKGAYIVVAGDYNVDENEGTEQEAFIEDFYIHEEFRKGHKMNNDIALIKLKGAGFNLNEHVQAICLPDIDVDYYGGLNCTISGFGSIQSGKSAFSHDLRAGWIPIQKREICKMPHVYGDSLMEGMICAGNLDEGIDSCDGDSGGPLACLNDGTFTLFGITSWGQHCGYANKPGVYVKVAHYRKWIDDTLKKYM